MEVPHLPRTEKVGRCKCRQDMLRGVGLRRGTRGSSPHAPWRWRRRSFGAGRAGGQIPLCHFLAAWLRARLLSPRSSVSLSAEWETTSGRLILTVKEDKLDTGPGMRRACESSERSALCGSPGERSLPTGPHPGLLPSPSLLEAHTWLLGFYFKPS